VVCRLYRVSHMGMRGGKQTKEQQELEGRVEAIILAASTATAKKGLSPPAPSLRRAFWLSGALCGTRLTGRM